MKTNQDHQRIATAFDRLFRTYPQFGQGSTPEEVTRDRVEKAKVYFDAVALYSEDDVEAAVEAILTGSAAGSMNPNFAPPAPAFAGECRRQMNMRLDRARDRRPRLPPPDIEKTPEQRQRAIEQVQAFLASQETEAATEAEAKRKSELWAKTNERFYPDMSDEAVKDRLMKPREMQWTTGNDQEDAA